MVSDFLFSRDGVALQSAPRSRLLAPRCPREEKIFAPGRRMARLSLMVTQNAYLAFSTEGFACCKSKIYQRGPQLRPLCTQTPNYYKIYKYDDSEKRSPKN